MRVSVGEYIEFKEKLVGHIWANCHNSKLASVSNLSLADELSFL